MAQVQRLSRHQDNRLLTALEPEDFAHLEPHPAIVGLQRGHPAEVPAALAADL
jgi:hypothetical protein